MMDYFRLGEKLNPKPDGESAVRHRTGVITNLWPDGTVDLDLGGAIASGVSVLAGAAASVGQVVQVIAWSGDLLVLGGIGTPGFSLLQTVYFTTSDTFDKADYPGLGAVKVVCQGGGGGGGGAGTTAAGQNSIGQTGSGGVYAEKFVLASALAASETVTVGAAGAGAAAGGNGSNGGASSFGAHCSANGGEAGGRTGPAAVPTMVSGKSPVTTGTGDLVIPGGGSDPTELLFAVPVRQPHGGHSVLGSSTAIGASATVATGAGGVGHGSGGGGGINAASQGTARTGGAGAPGIVIVEAYV